MSIADYFLSSDFRRANYGERKGSSWGFNQRTFVIALIAIITFMLSMSFGLRAQGDVGLNFQNGAKLLIWVALVNWALFEWRVILPTLMQPAGYLLCFIGIYAACSALWSPVPLYTLGSALGWLAYIGLACLAVKYVEVDVVLATIFWSLFSFIAVSFALAFVMPDTVWMPPSDVENVFRFVGLTDHPNNFGHFSGLYLVFTMACVSRKIISTKWALFHGLIGLTALGLSGDRTIAFVLLLITILVAMRYSVIARYIAFGVAIPLTIVFFLYAAGVGPDLQSFMESMSRTGNASEIMTLTGRTEIWSAAIDRIFEKPIFGWGFNGTEQLMLSSAPLRFYGNPVNAHEMYLQIALSLGVVGLLPSIVLVALPIHAYFHNPKFYRDIILGLILLNGLTEADIFATPVLSGFVAFWLLLLDGAPSPSFAYHEEA